MVDTPLLPRAFDARVDEKHGENDENEQPNINELEEAAAHKFLHELNGNNGNKKSAF